METTRDPWGEEEFGLAQLGDERRVQRLTSIAAQVLRVPGGRVTGVFSSSAEREGAFRLLENDAVDVEEIALAAHRACARRCADQPFAFVPVDETSLRLVDTKGNKRLGVVGARNIGATGLQVMTAMAVSPEGFPVGLCGQETWTRVKRSKGKKKHDTRKVASKETQHWLNVMQQVQEVFEKEAPKTRPWFQLDRAGDAWPVLLAGLKLNGQFTVRASHNRRLLTKEDGPRVYLWDQVESQLLLDEYELEVPARAVRRANWHQRTVPARRGRTARMQVRTCRVTVDTLDERTGTRRPARLYAVLAREAEATAQNDEAIEWLLLTSHPVRTREDARLVLKGYAQRWRIEEFHKAWKSGACKVEETQLRDRAHIERWATILASVAARIVRLTYLARTTPEAPATIELTEPEIEAILLANRRGPSFRNSVTISQAVSMLAKIGGYTGTSSGGPPGAIVITRGLQRIELLAHLIACNIVRRSDQ